MKSELGDIYKTKLEDEIAIVDQQRKRLDELRKTATNQESSLYTAIHKSLKHKDGKCYCTSPKVFLYQILKFNFEDLETL